MLKSFLKKIDNKINPIKAIIGKYMSGEKIISVIPGTSEFWSITFSKPLPMETNTKTPGTIPHKVEKKIVF